MSSVLTFELPIPGLYETYELRKLDNPISTKERKP